MIKKLGNEKEKWIVSVAEERKNRENLTGDILISSGIIAYLGVFETRYRLDCIENWI